MKKHPVEMHFKMPPIVAIFVFVIKDTKKYKEKAIEHDMEIRLIIPPITVFIRVSPFLLKVNFAFVEKKSKFFI